VSYTHIFVVVKVYHENTKMLISDKVAQVAKICMIDKACVPPTKDNIYILSSIKHLVAKGV